MKDVPVLWEDSCQAGLQREAGQGLFGIPGQPSEHQRCHRVRPGFRVELDTMERAAYTIPSSSVTGRHWTGLFVQTAQDALVDAHLVLNS